MGTVAKTLSALRKGYERRPVRAGNAGSFASHAGSYDGEERMETDVAGLQTRAGGGEGKR